MIVEKNVNESGKEELIMLNIDEVKEGMEISYISTRMDYGKNNKVFKNKDGVLCIGDWTPQDNLLEIPITSLQPEEWVIETK